MSVIGYSGDFISPEFDSPGSFISPEFAQELDVNAAQGELSDLKTMLLDHEQSRFRVLTSEFRSVNIFAKIMDFVLRIIFNDSTKFNETYSEKSIKNRIVDLLNYCKINNVEVNDDLFRLLTLFAAASEQRGFGPLTTALIHSNPLAYIKHSPEGEIELRDAGDVLDMPVDPNQHHPEILEFGQQ